jgi:outer membrane protein assembly factor BamB
LQFDFQPLMSTAPIPDEESAAHRDRPRGWLVRGVPAGIVALGIGLAAYAFSSREIASPPNSPVNPTGPAKRTAATGDWPNLFGPTHDSRSLESIRVDWADGGPAELWRVTIGRGYSSPIVAGNRVVVLHRVADEEIVSCFDVMTGESLWERRDPTSFVCGSHYTDGPYSTPAAQGDRLITLGAEGRLLCLDVRSGDVLWQRATSEEFQVEPGLFGVGHSPLIWNEQVILNIGGTTPDSGNVAFELATGAVRWQATDHGAAFATPMPALIHGRERLFVLTEQGLVMLDPADGRVCWEFPCTSRSDRYNAVTPVVWQDLVLVSVLGPGSTCLRIQPDDSYTPLWENRTSLTSQYNPLLCDNGCVFGVHAADNSFRCIELETGKVRWRWKSALARSTHLLAGGQILLCGEFGELGVIDADPQQLVERAMGTVSVFDGERCYSAPALAGGKLFLRNERELVCFDMRPVAP